LTKQEVKLERLSKMKKEEIVHKFAGNTLICIGWIQAFFLLLFISSPFVWIWIGWGLTWKIALSGIIGMTIAGAVYNGVKKAVERGVDEILEKSKHDPKS